ncbi:hypothetical protein B0H13DRAFT_1866881 [Mycena leptocephala]|nr:hypothetical protein B0H13DRAFT_1866881 [Mycena leptocephala]
MQHHIPSTAKKATVSSPTDDTSPDIILPHPPKRMHTDAPELDGLRRGNARRSLTAKSRHALLKLEKILYYCILKLAPKKKKKFSETRFSLYRAPRSGEMNSFCHAPAMALKPKYEILDAFGALASSFPERKGQTTVFALCCTRTV